MLKLPESGIEDIPLKFKHYQQKWFQVSQINFLLIEVAKTFR